jgi:hypothetical protein
MLFSLVAPRHGEETGDIQFICGREDYDEQQKYQRAQQNAAMRQVATVE